jgi:putative phosphoribosyl transferase
VITLEMQEPDMPRFDALFADRRDAGRRLAQALADLRESDPVILALPRGGVPVAFEVAKSLQAPLDVLIVRKIGAPGRPELGIGAVIDGDKPHLVLNDDVIRQVRPSAAYIDTEKRRQLAEIERRRRRYLGDRPAIPVASRTAVVVDDGIATGGTVRAALRGVAAMNPARLVLAVPLAPADTLTELAADCDEIVCLATPEPFYAVGAHYRDFTQTPDEEVVQLLIEASQWSRDGLAQHKR